MEFHDNEKHNRFCKVRVSERMCHAQAGIWIVEILLLLGKYFPERLSSHSVWIMSYATYDMIFYQKIQIVVHQLFRQTRWIVVTYSLPWNHILTEIYQRTKYRNDYENYDRFHFRRFTIEHYRDRNDLFISNLNDMLINHLK